MHRFSQFFLGDGKLLEAQRRTNPRQSVGGAWKITLLKKAKPRGDS